MAYRDWLLRNDYTLIVSFYLSHGNPDCRIFEERIVIDMHKSTLWITCQKKLVLENR